MLAGFQKLVVSSLIAFVMQESQRRLYDLSMKELRVLGGLKFRTYIRCVVVANAGFLNVSA
jgi:hypothetical protein